MDDSGGGDNRYLRVNAEEVNEVLSSNTTVLDA
mgnify:CR=1 FL=1|jgi:hypothetical protein